MKTTGLLAPLLLFPYIVGFAPVGGDSSSTQISFGAGGGRFADVSRDCQGRPYRVEEVTFDDVAVSVDRYTPVVHLGVSAGTLSPRLGETVFGMDYRGDYLYGERLSPLRRTVYAAPIVGVDLGPAAFDAGLAFNLRESPGWDSHVLPVGMVRVGRPGRAFVRFSLGANQPLLSGGPGVANLGVGVNLGRPGYTLFVGVGGGGFDGPMLGTWLEFPLGERVFLRVNGEAGGSETTEYGLSAGTRIVF